MLRWFFPAAPQVLRVAGSVQVVSPPGQRQFSVALPQQGIELEVLGPTFSLGKQLGFKGTMGIQRDTPLSLLFVWDF